MGFEPTDGGFADLSLRPLGYRAGANEYSETAFQLSVANINGWWASFAWANSLRRPIGALWPSWAHFATAYGMGYDVPSPRDFQQRRMNPLPISN